MGNFLGAARTFGWVLLVAGTASAAPPPATGGEQVDRAQAAVAEAEQKLQQAIDSDRVVIGARARSAHAKAVVEAARDEGQGQLQAAATAYQQAKAEESAAIKAAAPKERAE